MKFNKVLRDRVHPQWASHYLNYKSLKKYIKLVRSTGNTLETQEAFMSRFMDQLTTVDDFFLSQVGVIEKNFNTTCERLCGVAPVVVGDKSVAVENEATVWAQVDQLLISAEESVCDDFLVWLQGVSTHIELLRNFVTLNQIACRKILKKFDKQTGTTDCQTAIMKDVVSRQPFLSSQRLGLVLTRVRCFKTLVTRRFKEAGRETTGRFKNFTGSLAMTAVDWQCHICLEIVDKENPVVLACGHKFCAGCAEKCLEVGHQCPVCRRNGMLGPFNATDPVIAAFLQLHVCSDKENEPVADSPVGDQEQPTLKAAGTPHPDLGHNHPVELASFSTLMEHASPKAYFVFDIDETIIVPGTFPSMLLSPYGIRSINELLQKSNGDMRLSTRRYLRQLVMDAVNTRKLIEPITAEVVKNLQEMGCTVFCLTARHSRSVGQTKQELLKVGVDFSVTSPFPNNSLLTDPVTGAVCEDGIIFANGNHKGTVLNRFLEGFVFRDLYSLGSEWKNSEAAQKVLPDRIIFVDDQLPNCWTVQNSLATAGRFCIPVLSYHYQRASYCANSDLVHSRGFKPAIKSQRPNHTQAEQAEGAPVALDNEILKMQLKYFMSYHVLIGDKEARRLLKLKEARVSMLNTASLSRPKSGSVEKKTAEGVPDSTAAAESTDKPQLMDDTDDSEANGRSGSPVSSSVFSIFKNFRVKY
mmetsp:Transcript_16435/g.23107  ORF Transcript_16435/g.23107 Transcript_16435/m.23107 type:complete len:696 (-) Transcript_16435:278-2365(-)